MADHHEDHLDSPHKPPSRRGSHRGSAQHLEVPHQQPHRRSLFHRRRRNSRVNLEYRKVPQWAACGVPCYVICPIVGGFLFLAVGGSFIGVAVTLKDKPGFFPTVITGPLMILIGLVLLSTGIAWCRKERRNRANAPNDEEDGAGQANGSPGTPAAEQAVPLVRVSPGDKPSEPANPDDVIIADPNSPKPDPSPASNDAPDGEVPYADDPDAAAAPQQPADGPKDGNPGEGAEEPPPYNSDADKTNS
ncbi:Hypp5083 [Branchiostoma lanceolatum]|uniref:Hypp5083 protein n=1 Tax=Branchiostoma lanceolatum TaxID=7740 RepID=A0A8K0ADG0_BRALA|nr:Hypp5083 [Branchiostoma lanceolatum]